MAKDPDRVSRRRGSDAEGDEPEEFIPEDLLENAIRTEAGLSEDVQCEEIVQGDSDEVFWDRLSRDANPWTVVTGAYKALKVVMIVGGRDKPLFYRVGGHPQRSRK
jgi:hypothetical protein